MNYMLPILIVERKKMENYKSYLTLYLTLNKKLNKKPKIGKVRKKEDFLEPWHCHTLF